MIIWTREAEALLVPVEEEAKQKLADFQHRPQKGWGPGNTCCCGSRASSGVEDRGWDNSMEAHPWTFPQHTGTHKNMHLCLNPEDNSSSQLTYSLQKCNDTREKDFKILTFGCHPNERPDYQMKSHAQVQTASSNSDRQQPQVSKVNLQKGSDSLENQNKI